MISRKKSLIASAMGVSAIAALAIAAVSSTHQVIPGDTASTAGSALILDKTAKKSGPEPIVTVKPGAAIDFKSKIDGPLLAGAYSDVIVTLDAAYFSGTLSATASGTSGLDVLASSAVLDHNMSDGPIEWRITVRPQDDSRHYLNIAAQVSQPGQSDTAFRAFSVAIGPGEVSKISRKDSSSVTVAEDGEQQLIIMPAQETVSPGR